MSFFRSFADLALAVCDFECLETEALDRGEDVVGGLGPAEGFGLGVDRRDVAGDGGLEVVRGTMNTAADLLVGQFGEEALNPRLRGGRLWLIQEADVGVRWTCHRGRLVSHLRIAGVLWVA